MIFVKFTCGTLHNIADLIVTIVGTGIGAHHFCFVPYQDRLPTSGHHLLVIDPAELNSGEPSTIDDHICFLSRMMERCSFNNVLEDCSFEYNSVFQALRYQPWQVNSSVDAHGRKGVSAVIASG